MSEDPAILPVSIRPETRDDVPVIRTLVERAFREVVYSTGNEATIIQVLRAADALAVSLVAEHEGRLVGHVAASPVTIDGRHTGWFGLGPVAVAPDMQRRGIGQMLVRACLRRLGSSGATGCVVLGEPGFYQRFGFRGGGALRCPGLPPAYFQHVCFTSDDAGGEVAYHPAFGT